MIIPFVGSSGGIDPWRDSCSISAAASQQNGERCAYFDDAKWWDALVLRDDPRFRIMDYPTCYGVGCLSTEDMRKIQDRFRPVPGDYWKRESDRLHGKLSEAANRWWVVVMYEWESGID
jgi:hypothetical protein